MNLSNNLSYIRETLDFLLKKSSETRISPDIDYLSIIQQGKISPINRENLMNWVFETCEVQKISKKAEQLSILYIDTFLSVKCINNLSILELIGYICISLALKYEEGREITCSQIFTMCQQKFSIEAIITTEIYLLSLLDWKLDLTTPSEILNYLLKFTCEDLDSNTICRYAEGYINIAMIDYEVSRNSSFTIAISSVLCVLDSKKYDDFSSQWLQIIEKDLNVKTFKVREVAEKIKLKLNSLLI